MFINYTNTEHNLYFINFKEHKLYNTDYRFASTSHVTTGVKRAEAITTWDRS
jgi:hypothetical protein